MTLRRILCTLTLLLAATISLAAETTFRLDSQLEGVSWAVDTAGGTFVVLWFRPAGPSWQLVSRGNAAAASHEIGLPVANPVAAVARSPRGPILAVWFDDLGFVRGQFLDSQGAPDGPDFAVAPIGDVGLSLSVAADRDGFSVLWTTAFGFSYFQRLASDGLAVGERVTRAAPFDGFGVGGRAHRVAIAANGDAMIEAFTANRRLEGTFFTTLESGPVPPDGSRGVGVELAVEDVQSSIEPSIGADAGIGYGVAWTRLGTENRREIWFQRLDISGRPAASPRRVDDGDNDGGDAHSPRVACDFGGACLVVWQRDGVGPSKVMVRTFDTLGHPFGPAEPVIANPASSEIGGNVAFTFSGELLISLFARAADPTTTSLPDESTGLLGVRRFLPCRPTLDTVCLREGRFAVRVTLDDDLNPSGFPAPAVPMTSDTGGFWFFSEDNLEVLVKVLDGRPVNGHFWVLFGSLSNLPYTVEVTNTRTRETRRFTNPDDVLASQAITEAFADDGSPPTAAVPVLDAPDGACPGLADRALCLTSGRFRATVEWLDPRSGRTGFGTGRLISENSGAFWFFGPENLELIVKVLDGRISNGHFWAFVGSLTDVEFEIRIDDTVTGESWTHRKPPFVLESHADIEALPAP